MLKVDGWCYIGDDGPASKEYRGLGGFMLLFVPKTCFVLSNGC